VADFRVRLGQLFVFGLFVGAACQAGAAPTKADDSAMEMAAKIRTELALPFRLPDEVHLDADLRAEAKSIASAHLARIQQLLPGWIEEERRVQRARDGKPSDGYVFFAVFARVLNELALWQLEPGDAAYEKATLDVLKATPAACQYSGDSRFNDFASRIMRIQAMPPGQRQAALAAERRLLEHWGKPRPALQLQPWPNPLPQDAAMAAVEKIQAGGERPPLALPPDLASELLGNGVKYKDLPGESRCELKRWWMLVSLAQGTSPEAALNAFRYATLIGAMDRYGRAFESEAEETSKEEAGSAPRYPRLAQRFDVSGTTTVSRRFDAAGKPVEVNVVERKITVPGIRGVRPVAFENTFDALSLHQGFQGGDAAKPGAPLPPVFQMVWTLDPPKGEKP